jgi:hypothetical protein
VQCEKRRGDDHETVAAAWFGPDSGWEEQKSYSYRVSNTELPEGLEWGERK